MAIELAGFVDERGVEYPASYWRVAAINISVVDGAVGLLLYGYKDAEARLAGAQPIGQRQYSIAGQQFADLYAQEVTLQQNLATLSYSIAKGAGDGEDGKSFFDGGKDT